MSKKQDILNREIECIVDSIVPPTIPPKKEANEKRKELLAEGRKNLYKEPDNKKKNEEIQRILEKDFASERLLKIDEAAALLGVTTQTIRNWDNSGKLKAIRTDGGHRRFKEADINAIRKEQMHSTEILFHGTTPVELEGIFTSLVKDFDPLEKINLTVRYDTVYNKVRVMVESADGLVGNSRSFYLHGNQKQ